MAHNFFNRTDISESFLAFVIQAQHNEFRKRLSFFETTPFKARRLEKIKLSKKNAIRLIGDSLKILLTLSNSLESKYRCSYKRTRVQTPVVEDPGDLILFPNVRSSQVWIVPRLVALLNIIHGRFFHFAEAIFRIIDCVKL